jgi:hypothetical protein
MHILHYCYSKCNFFTCVCFALTLCKELSIFTYLLFNNECMKLFKHVLMKFFQVKNV